MSISQFCRWLWFWGQEFDLLGEKQDIAENLTSFGAYFINWPNSGVDDIFASQTWWQFLYLSSTTETYPNLFRFIENLNSRRQRQKETVFQSDLKNNSNRIECNFWVRNHFILQVMNCIIQPDFLLVLNSLFHHWINLF